jgi:DNA-binding MarR family transcriptional regulator
MTANRDDFGVLLALAYVTFVEELHERLSGYERFGAWTGIVLRALDDGPMSLTNLAELLEMSSAGALKIIGPMVEDGYLERVPDPNDRRVRAIALTRKGRSALREARRFHADFEASLVEVLGPNAVRATRRTLEAIVEREARQVPKIFRAPRRGGYV